MKTIRLLTTILLAAGICYSCSSDDDGGMPERVAVQFSTANITVPKTTAGGDQWVTGDRIGIFMLKDGQSLSKANIAEGVDNVQYKADAGSNNQSSFSPVSSTIYYPVNDSKVDFIAYYPYKATGTNAGEIENYTYPVDVSSQTKPEDIDVLYSNNARGYSKNSSTVDLQFDHALSKVSFSLTSGIGSPNLTGAKIKISDVATTATMELADGTTTSTNSGTIIANTAADGLSSSAIVIPQTLSGTKLIVTLSDNVSKFEWTFTTTEFKEGKQYPYNITVDKTGITVTTGDIIDWTGTGDSPSTGGAGIWKVGDYYPDPKATTSDGGATWTGTKPIGVVFWVDPADSRHGKVVGLQERIGVAWSGLWGNTKANNMANGLVNMATIYNLANDFSGYPAFAWVHNMNDASEDYSNSNATGVWNLPAIDELQHLYCAWNNKEPDTWSYTPAWGADDTARANFNSKLTAAGGTGLGGYYYWSSSEYFSDASFVVYFFNGQNDKNNIGDSSCSARCILAF